jgi:transposase
MKTAGACSRRVSGLPSRRGRDGEDDRLFLEALHFFTLENVRWRALPEQFGHWNSVLKRFDRLSKAGVFEAFFDVLASVACTTRPTSTIKARLRGGILNEQGAPRRVSVWPVAIYTLQPAGNGIMSVAPSRSPRSRRKESRR